MDITLDGHPIDFPLTIGILLLAILLNAYLFGVISQQFYLYWYSSFADSKRVKAFVIIQFLVNTFQTMTLWHMAWSLFIDTYGQPLDPQACTWSSLAHSASQCLLVLFANLFLAIRIYTLTKSRLLTGLIVFFSTSAFIIGLYTTVITWDATLKSSYLATLSLSTTEKATSVVWHVLQVIAESLITIFLARALLSSRSGHQKTDGVLNYLVRRVIQIGFFATLWTIAALALFFMLPRTLAYRFFDMTVGPMYTHVIYDTLLSRTQLRERMSDTHQTDIRFSPQSQEKSNIHDASPLSKGPNGLMRSPNSSLTTSHVADLRETLEHDDSEAAECAPIGLPKGQDDLPYSQC
ncbi:hypothetical protein BGW80DRAFT_1308759 [Lactifluus volemus]|nr:hypothetical protein BGW80DRAFT_1308759 [Lactifluus volemus]